MTDGTTGPRAPEGAAEGTAPRPEEEGSGRPQPAPTGPPRWGQYAPGYGPGPQGGQWPQVGEQGEPKPVAPPSYGQPGAVGYRQAGYGPAGQYGQYGQQGSGQGDEYGQWQYGPAAQGYGPTQAPRPGIIPLRPLALGELLDGAFRAIRTNPRVMFGLSAVVVTLTALVQLGLTWSLYADLEAFLTLTEETTPSEPEAMNAVADLLGQLATAMGAQTISSLVTTILSGLLIVSVSQSVLGRTASLGEVWASARGQLLRLLALSVLVFLIVISPLVPWVALTIGAMAQEQWELGVAVALLGGVVAIGAVFFLLTRTVLATPALMLERSGIFAALRRGWVLSRGTFWRVLGIYLLTLLLVSVVSAAIGGTTSVFFQVAAMSDPTGPIFTPAYLIATTIAQTVAAALTTPFAAAVVALLYIDVRMRTEGLDLELARAAADRTA